MLCLSYPSTRGNLGLTIFTARHLFGWVAAGSACAVLVATCIYLFVGNIEFQLDDFTTDPSVGRLLVIANLWFISICIDAKKAGLKKILAEKGCQRRAGHESSSPTLYTIDPLSHMSWLHKSFSWSSVLRGLRLQYIPVRKAHVCERLSVAQN